MRKPVLPCCAAALAAALLLSPRPDVRAQEPVPLIVNNWPFYSGELTRGRNGIFIQNGVNAPVTVMIRFRGMGPHAGMGRDVELVEGAWRFLTVPDGQYEVYYRYGIGGSLQLWGQPYLAGRDLGIEVPAPGAPVVPNTATAKARS
jgi:hypothetical protein